MNQGNDKIELVHGSGNEFGDLGHPNANTQQQKALLAAEIIKTLDRQNISARAAQARTRIPAADLSRIRNADLRRFGTNRLTEILNCLQEPSPTTTPSLP